VKRRSGREKEREGNGRKTMGRTDTLAPVHLYHYLMQLIIIQVTT
jgi:hypothetical protein